MTTREVWNVNRRRAEAVNVVLAAASEFVYAKGEPERQKALEKLKAALDEADRLGVVYNKGDRGA